ncbi:hypothetical protein TRAPUB_5591 [Trametes pubescens]|uniref:Uncharacterized protein n=1 Tax=Trametes pubescens TaxID=154538 RepID=A0A1M2V843_TRAPU|nr:hypothetical protein TRAPUB_5591 [Trametes pubescens]
MKERENLGANRLEGGDAVKYFQEAATELELETVFLKGRLPRPKDFKENRDHMREYSDFCFPNGVYHLAQFACNCELCFEIYE